MIDAVERYVAAYSSGDTSGIAAIIAPSFVDHAFPAFSGVDGVARAIATLHTGLSEVSCRLEQCVGDSMRAAFCVIVSGRHTGVLAGRAPTGKIVTWAISDFVRIEDGKLVELWSVQDTSAFLSELSAAPQGWHAVTTRIVTADVAGLVAFLRAAFDATGDVPEDRPAVLQIGDSKIMISSTGPRPVTTAMLYVYVPDADTTYRRAIAAGATSLEEPLDTPYGDRRAMVQDRWGCVWQIATHCSGGSSPFSHD